MKIDTRYTSMWDELPAKYSKPERKIPTTQDEARDFYEAAESSMHKSIIKTMDGHNERVKESAELRKIKHRKEDIEREVQEARDRQREYFAEAAEEARKKYL